MAKYIISKYNLLIGDTLIIETLDIEKHDLKRVSELIYSTDSDFNLKVFKQKEKAIRAIEKMLILRNNGEMNDESMVEYVLLKEDNEIVGYLQLIKGEEMGFLKISFFLIKNLPLLIAIKLIYREFSYSFILTKINRDDIYLVDLAINDKEQGKGFGTFLLNETIKIAKKENFKRVTLDVEFSNKNALKLYQKIGFTIFNKRCAVFNKNRGMYNMQYIL